MGIFEKNYPEFSAVEIRALANAHVCITGLGGTGGIAFLNLLRAGIGRFTLYDGDKFEESNFNRQMLANSGSLGKNKALYAQEHVPRINPDVKITAYAQNADKKTLKKLRDCDVFLGCTDTLESRIECSDFCAEKKIPYIFCSAGGSRAMASVFSGVRVSDVFKKEMKRGATAIAPCASIAGTTAASLAISVLLGREHVKAPEFLFFDLASKRFFWKARL
jgi:molybdopterin/thiamine biosynthesis adenylyltransferase